MRLIHTARIAHACREALTPAAADDARRAADADDVPLARICSWCDTVLTPGREPGTHTCCRACLAKFFPGIPRDECPACGALLRLGECPDCTRMQERDDEIRAMNEADL